MMHHYLSSMRATKRLQDVADDEIDFFFLKWLCRSILEHCCDKLETMRCASQNHAVSKKNGIQHGFGTSEEFKDGVSQVCFLFVLGRCGVLSFLQRFFEALACRKQT